MANAEVAILVRLRDEASKGLQSISKQIQDSSKQLKIAGTAFTGFGLAILGGLVMVTKAAAEEEAGIIRLAGAMKTVGVSYDDVKGSLEALIDATQQKTAFADDQQREALTRLITITGDYNRALSLLPLAMDIARAKGMDLQSAAELVGRVAQGNTGILLRYGIVLGENATAMEALAELQKKFAGQAEAYGQTTAGQLELLKENLGDMAEAIGVALLPMVKELAKDLNVLTQWFKGLPPWVQEAIAKSLLFAAAVSLVIGPTLIFLGLLPKIVAGIVVLKAAWLGLSFVFSASTIGLIILAFAALIAIGVLVYKNWDTIKEKLVAAWGAIVRAAQSAFEALKAAASTAMKAVLTYMLAPFKGFLELVDLIVTGISKIPLIGDKIPGIGTLGKWIDEGKSLIDSLTFFAQGGIVTKPTLGIVGEAGPEAIIPLSGRGGMTGTVIVNVTVQGSVLSDRELADIVRQELIRTGRANVTALGSFA